MPTDPAINDVIKHAQGESLASCSVAYSDLPDKNRVGTFRHEVARDGPYDDTVKLGNDRGVTEMGALQQIAVEGIRVQWWTVSNELVDRRAVCRNGLPKAREPIGAIRFLRCNDYTP